MKQIWIYILESLEDKAVDNIQIGGSGLIDIIIKAAKEKRTSDIHIESFEKTIRVKYGIYGELVTVVNWDSSRKSQIDRSLKAISNTHQEKQKFKDGRILLYPDYNIHVFSQRNACGEKFCLKLLRKIETFEIFLN